MFKRVSYMIALQFTGFVFLLFLINGAAFLVADFGHVRREAGFRLGRTIRAVIDRAVITPNGIDVALPPPMRERVRIVNRSGATIFSGGFFEGIPFSDQRGYSTVVVQNERYDMLTSALEQNGEVVGYVQVAEVDRFQARELPPRAGIYVLVSLAVTALTFFAGLFFAKRSLRPAQQMMTRLEQFTQDASHELRTPLATLNSSLDLALKTGQHREGILSAKDDARQIAIIIERLLELARLDKLALRAETIDLSSLAQDAVARHALLGEEKNVSVTGSVAPNVIAEGDATLTRQILDNLLSNAVKFSKSAGGNVTVTLTKKELTVTDTGVGIPRESLPHIFDRFYQADASRSEGGYGLGLALVKRIVDLQGWSIVVKSDEGSGATFTVAFS